MQARIMAGEGEEECWPSSRILLAVLARAHFCGGFSGQGLATTDRTPFENLPSR
jgi:hypothetical protein